MIAWKRLAPWWDPLLERVAGALGDREEGYPAATIARLRSVGIADVLAGDAFTAWHVNGLNAVTAHFDASLAITLGVNGLALLPVALAGTEEQQRRVFSRIREGTLGALLLTELDHGSNLLRNQARAARVGEEWRLSGEKHLINGGTRHDVLVAFMRTRDAGGEGPLAAAGDFTLFLVERDASVEALPAYATLPVRGADIAGVRFHGTPGQVLGGEGRAFSTIQKTLTISRGAISSLASGTASRARDVASEYAGTRNVYGAPIAALGAIARHLRELEALDLVVAALSVKAAALSNALGLGVGSFTAVAKVACCDLAEEAVTCGRRVMGARALIAGDYERLVRDVLLYGVFDGTSHVMLEQVHWRLAQVSRDEGEADLEVLRRIYAEPPRPFVRSLRENRPVPRWGLAHLRALGVPFVDLARELFGIVGSLRESGAWEKDQAIRFHAAETYALLEALTAMFELTHGRERLGLPRVDVDATFALDWLGARAAERVRELTRRSAH